MQLKLFVIFISLLFIVQHITAQQLHLENPEMKILSINPYDIVIDEFAELDLVEVENKAYLIFLQKDYYKAAKYYLYLTRHNSENGKHYFRLAQCYAHLGNPLYAANFLVFAVNFGFDDFKQIDEDEGFKKISNDKLFSKTLSQVKSVKKMVGEKVYIEAKKIMESRVFLPESFDQAKGYKLVVCLHGRGGNNKFVTQQMQNLENKEFIFVVPEAPYVYNPDGSSMKKEYSWGIEVMDVELWKRSDPYVTDYILDVHNHFKEKYNITESYLIGFSQGAGMAYCTGIKNSSKFDGIICFGGALINTEKYPWLLSEEQIKENNNLDVYIVHGKNDLAVDYKYAQKAKKKLKKYGYNVELHTFEGGHNVPLNEFKRALQWATNR